MFCVQKNTTFVILYTQNIIKAIAFWQNMISEISFGEFWIQQELNLGLFAMGQQP
jgi:hypothetical protein